MSDGTIPVKLVDKISRSKEQAQKLFQQKQELEEQLIHKSSSEGLEAEDISSPLAQSHTFDLMQVHLQLSPLLTELQLLENPSMRSDQFSFSSNLFFVIFVNKQFFNIT